MKVRFVTVKRPTRYIVFRENSSSKLSTQVRYLTEAVTLASDCMVGWQKVWIDEVRGRESIKTIRSWEKKDGKWEETTPKA